MARTFPPRNDVGRIIALGVALMSLAYLLVCFINAEAKGGSVLGQFISPDPREIAVHLTFMSVLLLFIAYACGRMLKHGKLETALVKYQAGMDASMDGIFILDGSQQCAYVNESQARLHGYGDHTEVLGMSWRIFYDGCAIKEFEEDVFPAVFTKGEWRGEAVGRRRDGSTFPQEISLTAVDRGSIVCIVRDMTEQKRFESELQRKAEELTEANRELEAFGYSLTHDMRGYLGHSFSAAQLLRDELGASLGERGLYLLDVICDTNEAMDRLIGDMMVLSRITRTDISREAVDLSETARRIASVLMLTAPDRRAEFIVCPDLVAEGDPQLLRVLLDNLLGNAWKYTGMVSDAHIEFGAVARDGEQVFFVRDNGAGFAMKDADLLFRPFQRLPNARVFPGTGIGLATVQRIIHRHGGRVWGEGAEGKGATFFFTLPEPKPGPQ
ncbi:MAG TPA: ATP-binding protein [Geobacteraceae bacterium]